jgi:nucleoside-diphosphate-sugar epimerase
MRKNSSKVLITGATGWLGRETVARVLEGKIDGISETDLVLASSNGRDLDLDSLGIFATSALTEFSDAKSTDVTGGLVHLAFITKDKTAKYSFSEYVAKNIELISAACKIIEREKPKWVVVVSSGAIIDRATLEIENNVISNPYGFCKRIEEALISESARKVGANIVIGRLWGGTGLYMPIKRAYAISDFIESAKEKNAIRINSGGDVIRRYCDAGDFMEVLVKAALEGHTTTIDSGGSIIEVGELAKLISSRMGEIPISRSETPTPIDDYYPRGSKFEELAKLVGVQLHGMDEQVLRTLKSHKVQTLGRVYSSTLKENHE